MNIFSGNDIYGELSMLDIIAKMWLGKTVDAYIIPERWMSILEMKHLCENGRPMFYVIKEKFGINQLVTVEL